MTPTPLTVSIDNVVLTEEQAERVATALTQSRAARAEAEREAKRKAERTLRVGSSYGGEYLNIPRAVFEDMMDRFKKMDRPEYMVLEVDGSVGHNGSSVRNAPPLRAFQKGL